MADLGYVGLGVFVLGLSDEAWFNINMMQKNFASVFQLLARMSGVFA